MAQIETGVLPIQILRRILRSGNISGVSDKFLNPASMDLPISDEAYRLESIFLPTRGGKVRPFIRKAGGKAHDLRSPLEVGVPYLIRIEGKYEFPPNVYGYVNPKSSTGRVNLLCRVVADKVEMYDALTPEGWSGEMWVLVRANSFPVLLSKGQAVSQLRLFDGKTFLDPLDLNLAIREHGILFHQNGNRFRGKEIMKHDDSLLLTLRANKGVIGWECRGTNKVLDFGKLAYYRPEDFFESIESVKDSLKLREGSFYILTTDECVLVPPELSAELRPIDVRLGEFRSHAAGYIDPGWGWGKDGSVPGRPITLEVRVFEDRTFYHGQTIARIRYERMKHVPTKVYDVARSHYTMQDAAKLSKHFLDT